jgi:hypothetical protein
MATMEALGSLRSADTVADTRGLERRKRPTEEPVAVS